MVGGLFLREASIVAEHYLARRCWIHVGDEVRTANLLPARTAASALWASKEPVWREHLNEAELTELIEGSLRARLLALVRGMPALRLYPRFPLLSDMASVQPSGGSRPAFFR